MEEIKKKVVCKKSIFKSTYKHDAVTSGKSYEVETETKHFVWVNDNADRQFSFVRKDSLTLYPFCHVYEDHFDLEGR